MRLCGYAYSHVSAGLARRWNLPPLLADALQHLHAPLAQPGFDPLACVLHIAAWRARSREAQWGERALAVSFPGEVGRSEEHTSELQSRLHLVCRLLLEKKKNNTCDSVQWCAL